ncbi:MAG: PaaI family thioesterase [Gammaproteobacteria bacterium]|nr:PaaI family thioesterase [Gammaproteobacteria bacterium]MDE0366092.1 PaaI family thioesterase [Gammaproteobacteria bacterium]
MTGRLSNEDIVRRMQARAAPIESALGMKVLAVDQDSGCATVSFNVSREFTNTQGYVGGGTLATMLDIAMAVAGSAATGHRKGMVTLECKNAFLNPARIGLFHAKAKTRKKGALVSFLEAEIYCADDDSLVATGSATALAVEHDNSAR